MIGAGLKKCMPTTRSGSAAAPAMAVTGIEEVFVASTRVGGDAAQGGEQLALELEALGRRLDDEPGLGQRVELGDAGDLAGLGAPAGPWPAAPRRVGDLRQPALARPGTGSCRSVRAPAAAASCAIPAPMVPAPTTPMTSGISLTRKETN